MVSETEATTGMQALQTLVDRLWSGEAEIVRAYLTKPETPESEDRWLRTETWRSWVDCDLFNEAMRVGSRYPKVPQEVPREQYLLEVREVYLKMRPYDAFATLYAAHHGEGDPGFRLYADAAADEWAAEGRKVDALLALLRATGGTVGDAVIRLIGEMGLGVYWALAQGGSDAVKSVARTAISDGGHRFAIGLRRLQRVIEEDSGPFELLEIRKGAGQDAELVREPWEKAQSVLQLIVERRLIFRNDQFGRPLPPERLRAIQREEPNLSTRQISSLVGFIL